ncbi:hypothetical protein [Corynebacterium sp. CCUG 51687]|uniref:hypothetical protein n=1 Tax=Corynebacterium sp. CCUG 51687 TaxID=2823897 RepID=UPI0021094F94|nr:hypothetical protein [Corynebacterium sp. CCUG 51687]MCQ4611566.1 hypothetical protein [Corynebacterium sp. CCUG 51687]
MSSVNPHVFSDGENPVPVPSRREGLARVAQREGSRTYITVTIVNMVEPASWHDYRPG